MILLNTVVAALVLALPAADSIVITGGVRGPSVSRDGRVVVEVRGDLWLVGLDDAATVRLTDTKDWERDPVWTPDGSAVIYAAADASGQDLWKLAVGPGGALGGPVRLLDSSEREGEPAVLPGGGILFVRRTGLGANLWLVDGEGTERRLTNSGTPARNPAVSPDGHLVAYTTGSEDSPELRLLDLESGDDRLLLTDQEGSHPAWAVDGERIAFASDSDGGGVWITDADGSFTNLASRGGGEPAWTPDGRLLVADVPPSDPGYNGDPDRLGAREPQRLFPGTGGLRLLSDVGTPNPGAVVEARFPVDGPRHAEWVLDRVAERTADLYFRGADRADARRLWERAVEEARPRVLGADSEFTLEEEIHRLVESRPSLRVEARGAAAVSSAHPLATAAGLEALRRGGNVVDAAVAVSFALGVVEPDASGLGGYGEMLIHLVGMREPVVIDFLTRLPEAANLDNGALLDSTGELPAYGPVLANVPGMVDGMGLAFERFGSGTVEWSELVEPAIRLAENGFVLDDAFTTTLSRERARYLSYPRTRELFYRDGNPLVAGDTLVNPDLAWTLKQIAEGGARAFYEGEIAQRMVDDLRREGNVMTLRDLARYYAVQRRPVVGSYRGNTIFGSAPPTSGGASLVGKLNLLELAEAGGRFTEDYAKLHAMIEAWKLAPSTQGRLADPGLWPVDVSPFESKDTARVRWRCFRSDRAVALPIPRRVADCVDPDSVRGLPQESLPVVKVVGRDQDTDLGELCGIEPALGEGLCRAAGTTAFAVADAVGNMVAVTQTLGTWGGNFYVTPGLGFPYNDKLRSYGSDPDRYNARIPFARNVTSISPALVFRGTGLDRKPLMAVGAAGNAWITSAVYQVITSVIDDGMGPQRALESPRFLVAGRGGSRTVQYEDGFAPGVVRALEAMGHTLRRISLRGEVRMGYGAAVMVDGGVAVAGADPRRSGAAGAVRER
ncbi:MAG: gamma-glutamyltransferase [Longimicrobiales bacterium]